MVVKIKSIPTAEHMSNVYQDFFFFLNKWEIKVIAEQVGHEFLGRPRSQRKTGHTSGADSQFVWGLQLLIRIRESEWNLEEHTRALTLVVGEQKDAETRSSMTFVEV